MKVTLEKTLPRNEDLRCPPSGYPPQVKEARVCPHNMFLREGNLSCGAALVSCRAVHVATAAFIAWLERKSMRRINIHCPTDALMRKLF